MDRGVSEPRDIKPSHLSLEFISASHFFRVGVSTLGEGGAVAAINGGRDVIAPAGSGRRVVMSQSTVGLRVSMVLMSIPFICRE